MMQNWLLPMNLKEPIRRQINQRYDDVTYSVHQLIWYSVVLKAVE